VTERCRLLDLELLKNVVARLKSSGIRIALDDFGTGFSSVDILKEIPFDTIKIDRSFVWDIEKKETACRLVQSLVALGALFGARVCVEGVETAGMRDILRQFRAYSFQGYYYARPLPPEELLQWKNPHP
jgi:EAL domain-containing protein (putative c-di-GMP-specific phosphodiesterase class I)